MTEEEKQQLRKLKADTVSELQDMRDDISSRYSHALETDERLSEYVFEVIDHPDKHNLYEVLAVRRFFSMLDRHAWSTKRVRRFFTFYEALKFNGLTGRTRYKLTPVQSFQFANIFGFKDSDGRRLIRTAYIFVPRKFSKTTSAASLAVYDMLFGDNNAQAYVGANSYKQAKVCFDEIREIMRDIDKNGRHFRINREKIFFLNSGRDSSITCLSANARTLDGLNASLVIMDEYAQARNTSGKNGADLKNVLTSSMGTRLEPLTVVITTASDVLDGPFAHELEGVKAVLRGEMVQDSMFASLFMPDVDDEEGDPRTWAKVQPHLGITVQPDFYAREWENAQLSAENMMNFRNRQLNIFAVNEARAWIPASLATDISRPVSLETMQGRPEGMMAIDLSESDDFSAVTTGFYDKGNYTFHTAYFFPEGALPGHPNERLYRVWHEQGWLHLTPGSVIDYRTIVDYVLNVNNHVRILGIGYDQYKSNQVINMLASAGARNVLKAVSQTYGSFNSPVEQFEHGAKTGCISIDDNPINAYCFGNAVLDEDNMENKKPVKRTRYQKIDGVITMLMCLRMFIDAKR